MRAGRTVQPKGGAPAELVRTSRLLPGQIRIVGPGRALPPDLLPALESFFHADLSSVRVHTGPAASAIGAAAFTLGEDLYFAPGLFAPHTAAGLELLGHELAHVVQQRQGSVQNPFGDGVAVVQDPALEAEADLAGRMLCERITQGERPCGASVTSRATAQPMLRRIGIGPRINPRFNRWITTDTSKFLDELPQTNQTKRKRKITKHYSNENNQTSPRQDLQHLAESDNAEIESVETIHVVTFSDGSKGIARDYSKEGSPTLEFQDGDRVYKVRYNKIVKE
jgi:hypothetical protein